ncbi:hypothetical protein BKA70DRAFT_1433611 [Coprinopsis sp. MPI-PUGE-AT-0042]|nr:hypothetical protein BKA70DRAFT_1433611 [Coprinopsis sp. MPI-PUGE-AT-0042]
MGLKQFADAVLAEHLLGYDHLELQYMDFLAYNTAVKSWIGNTYQAFKAFDNRSPNGYHGFVPSAQWFRDMYDDFIEEHRHHIDQDMALRTAEICAVDHSHKIVKQIAKADGKQTFDALLTVTNQKGEYELALLEIRRSLHLYGLSPPKLFYTNNLADKAFLESAFPSLREDVIPIEKHDHLEPFMLPADVASNIHVQRDKQAIDAALGTILQHVPTEANEPDLVVGFDCEWNIRFTSDEKAEQGDIAIVQIAFEQRVYLLQVSDFLAHRELPESLTMLLQNPRIIKVGRMVGADLKQLERAVGSPAPFAGACDLATYAKARFVVTDGRCGLADLCAAVLKKRLSKNVAEQVSGAWEQPNLTSEQQVYAASDAFVALLIYQELSKYSARIPLPDSPLPSTPILLFSGDKTLIARGRIPDEQSSQLGQFDSINITRTRILVEITDTIVPGAIIPTHKKCSLSELGPPMFFLVCLKSHVWVYDPHAFALSDRDPDTPGQMDIDIHNSPPIYTGETIEEGDGSYGEMPLDGDDLHGPDHEGLEDSICNDETHNEGIGSSALHLPTPQNLSSYIVDQESEAFGNTLFSSLPTQWDPTVRSHVLKDVFHVFNMLQLSPKHGLRADFSRALHDILFVPNEEDRVRINAWAEAQTPPTTFDQLRATRPCWLWRRCRRQIPPSNILHPLVQSLFNTYRPLVDPKSKAPLFNQRIWKKAKTMISALVICPSISARAAPTFTEGGVHTHLLSRLPVSGVSIRHINASLSDFVLQHNLRVGTFNSTGKKYRSHYSIWVTNRLHERRIFLDGIVVNQQSTKGWVNGNLYLATSERIGILPILPDVCVATGMGEWLMSGAAEKQRYSYLARMQGTRKAVLPVHTHGEVKLFRELMQTDPSFNSQTRGPVWKIAVKVWNERAEGINGIYYKQLEQLQNHYNTWRENLRTCQLLSMTQNIRQPILDLARNPERSTAAPSVPQHHLSLPSVTQGYNTSALPSLAAEQTVNQAAPASNDTTPQILLSLTSTSHQPTPASDTSPSFEEPMDVDRPSIDIQDSCESSPHHDIQPPSSSHNPPMVDVASSIAQGRMADEMAGHAANRELKRPPTAGNREEDYCD